MHTQISIEPIKRKRSTSILRQKAVNAFHTYISLARSPPMHALTARYPRPQPQPRSTSISRERDGRRPVAFDSFPVFSVPNKLSCSSFQGMRLDSGRIAWFSLSADPLVLVNHFIGGVEWSGVEPVSARRRLAWIDESNP
jgi:hypothetical protein